MKKKWVYKLKAVFTPSCWFRNYKTHRGFDEWLWDSLNNCEIEICDKWTARINGKSVWIENAPYANGVLRTQGHIRCSCSRATAILLDEKLRDLPFH